MKWKVGEAAGIGIFVHWTFWLLPLFIVVSSFTAGGGLAGALAPLTFLFGIFACVVLHELGHALAARYYGIGTRDITLYPIGGVASLSQIPRKPWQEFVIAIAGPAVNVAIAAVLFAGLVIFGGVGSVFDVSLFGGSFLASLLVANIVLVVFNLLPAFPMDGGRVLRSLLAMKLDYVKATVIAARVGQGMAVLLGGLGIFVFQNPMTLVVAAFVFLTAGAEANLVQMQERMRAPSAAFFRATVDPFSPVTTPADGGIVWVTEVRTPTHHGDDPGIRIVGYGHQSLK